MVNASEAGRTKGKASQAQGADRRRAYSTGGPATREPGGKAFIASFWSPNLASSSSSSSPTSDGAYRVGSGGMRPNHASKSLKGEDPAGTKSQRRPDSAGREAFRSLGQGGTGGIGETPHNAYGGPWSSRSIPSSQGHHPTGSSSHSHSHSSASSPSIFSFRASSLASPTNGHRRVETGTTAATSSGGHGHIRNRSGSSNHTGEGKEPSQRRSYNSLEGQGQRGSYGSQPGSAGGTSESQRGQEQNVDADRRKGQLFAGSFVASLGMAPISTAANGLGFSFPGSTAATTAVSPRTVSAELPPMGPSSDKQPTLARGPFDGFHPSYRPVPTADPTLQVALRPKPPSELPSDRTGTSSGHRRQHSGQQSLRSSASAPNLRDRDRKGSAAAALDGTATPGRRTRLGSRSGSRTPEVEREGENVFFSFEALGGLYGLYARPRPKLRPFNVPPEPPTSGRKRRGSPAEREAEEEDSDAEVLHIRSIADHNAEMPRTVKRPSAERVAEENLASRIEREAWEGEGPGWMLPREGRRRAASLRERQRRKDSLASQGITFPREGPSQPIRRRKTTGGSTSSLTPKIGSSAPPRSKYRKRRDSDAGVSAAKWYDSDDGSGGLSTWMKRRPSAPARWRSFRSSTSRTGSHDALSAAASSRRLAAPRPEDSPPLPSSFDGLLPFAVARRKRSRAGSLPGGSSRQSSEKAHSRMQSSSRATSSNGHRVLDGTVLNQPRTTRSRDPLLRTRSSSVPSLRMSFADELRQPDPLPASIPPVTQHAEASLTPAPERKDGSDSSPTNSFKRISRKAPPTLSLAEQTDLTVAIATGSSPESRRFDQHASSQDSPSRTASSSVPESSAPYRLPQPPPSPQPRDALAPAPRRRRSVVTAKSTNQTDGDNQTPPMQGTPSFPGAFPDTVEAMRNRSHASLLAIDDSPTLGRSREPSGQLPLPRAVRQAPLSYEDTPRSSIDTSDAVTAESGFDTLVTATSADGTVRENGTLTSRPSGHSGSSSRSTIDLDQFIDQDTLFYQPPTAPRPDLLPPDDRPFFNDDGDSPNRRDTIRPAGLTMPPPRQLPTPSRQAQTRSQLVDEILSGYLRSPGGSSSPLSSAALAFADGYFGRRSSEDDERRPSLPTSVDGNSSASPRHSVADEAGFTIKPGPKRASSVTTSVEDHPYRQTRASHISRVPSIVDAYERGEAPATRPVSRASTETKRSRPLSRGSRASTATSRPNSAQGVSRINADSPNFLHFGDEEEDEEEDGPDTAEANVVEVPQLTVSANGESSPGLLSAPDSAFVRDSTGGRSSWRSGGSSGSARSLGSQIHRFPDPPTPLDRSNPMETDESATFTHDGSGELKNSLSGFSFPSMTSFTTAQTNFSRRDSSSNIDLDNESKEPTQRRP